MRNFPCPSVFELTSHRILIVKRGIRNVGQFLVAEVTNPGQNESQEMLHSVTGLIKKGDRGPYSSPNESPDWVRKEKEAELLARTLKTEVALFVSGNRNEEFSFDDRGRRERTLDLMPNSGRRSRAGVFRTAVGVIRCIETVAEIPGKSGKNLGQENDRRLQAKPYKIPLARKRENTLRRNPSES